MPDPHDTLAILAEVSVALAGFSGIVVAFGRRTQKPLSKLEIRRLFNLFTLSGTALILSLLSTAILHVESMSQSLLWSLGSGATVLLMGPWLVRDVIKVYRFDAQERQAINFAVIIIFSLLAAVTLVLQFANCLWMGQAWPFFIGLVVIVGGAFQQFVLLVHTELRHFVDEPKQTDPDTR